MDTDSPERRVTAEIDSRGRLTIHKNDRRALGILGQRALLDLGVSVLEITGDSDE